MRESPQPSAMNRRQEHNFARIAHQPQTRAPPLPALTTIRGHGDGEGGRTGTRHNPPRTSVPPRTSAPRTRPRRGGVTRWCPRVVHPQCSGLRSAPRARAHCSSSPPLQAALHSRRRRHRLLLVSRPYARCAAAWVGSETAAQSVGAAVVAAAPSRKRVRLLPPPTSTTGPAAMSPSRAVARAAAAACAVQVPPQLAHVALRLLLVGC